MIEYIVTHEGSFHADDVVAAAVLALLFDNPEIVRTRDLNLINSLPNSCVIDVGEVYDKDKLRFDHHQRDFQFSRENSVPYSSAGLIWLHFGRDLIAKSTSNVEFIEKVWSSIEADFIVHIDAVDNGIELPGPKTVQFSHLIFLMNARIQGEVSQQEINSRNLVAFKSAVEFTTTILQSLIAEYLAKCENKAVLEKAYQARTNKYYLFSPSDAYAAEFLAEKEDVLYYIRARRDGSWAAQAVPPSPSDMMSQRKPFPSSWCGLFEPDLKAVTGVGDAVFCHKNGFLAVAKSKEGIVALVEKAINS